MDGTKIAVLVHQTEWYGVVVGGRIPRPGPIWSHSNPWTRWAHIGYNGTNCGMGSCEWSMFLANESNRKLNSMLVTAFTCPSNVRTAALVSRSHIATEPSVRPVPRYRPVGSKRANKANAYNDVCTAVGCDIWKGSIIIRYYALKAAQRELSTDWARIHSWEWLSKVDRQSVPLICLTRFIFACLLFIGDSERQLLP